MLTFAFLVGLCAILLGQLFLSLFYHHAFLWLNHLFQVLFLLNKTNDDWWHVRKGSGKDGFVPANYVKEIEGKRIPVQVRQPFTVKDVRRVKKMRMAKGKVPVSKPKPAPKTTGNTCQLSLNIYIYLSNCIFN